MTNDASPARRMLLLAALLAALFHVGQWVLLRSLVPPLDWRRAPFAATIDSPHGGAPYFLVAVDPFANPPLAQPVRHLRVAIPLIAWCLARQVEPAAVGSAPPVLRRPGLVAGGRALFLAWCLVGLAYLGLTWAGIELFWLLAAHLSPRAAVAGALLLWVHPLAQLCCLLALPDFWVVGISLALVRHWRRHKHFCLLLGIGLFVKEYMVLFGLARLVAATWEPGALRRWSLCVALACLPFALWAGRVVSRLPGARESFIRHGGDIGSFPGEGFVRAWRLAALEIRQALRERRPLRLVSRLGRFGYVQILTLTLMVAPWCLLWRDGALLPADRSALLWTHGALCLLLVMLSTLFYNLINVGRVLALSAAGLLALASLLSRSRLLLGLWLASYPVWWVYYLRYAAATRLDGVQLLVDGETIQRLLAH